MHVLLILISPVVNFKTGNDVHVHVIKHEVINPQIYENSATHRWDRQTYA